MKIVFEIIFNDLKISSIVDLFVPELEVME